MTTSDITAARAIALHVPNRKRSPSAGVRQPRRTAETFAIRDSLLAATGRCPRPAVQLFATVTDDWGQICERRLYRALRWLLAGGKVRRVDAGYVRGPDVAPSPLEAELRLRAERSAENRCVDCDRHRSHPRDPAWFRVENLSCCFGCYQLRRRARRAA